MNLLLVYVVFCVLSSLYGIMKIMDNIKLPIKKEPLLFCSNILSNLLVMFELWVE